MVRLGLLDLLCFESLLVSLFREVILTIYVCGCRYTPHLLITAQESEFCGAHEPIRMEGVSNIILYIIF